MSLLVDVQLVPNKILEVVKARIMANRARLLAEQETAQVRGATRPRVQRPRFGATATTYRRPEPAAVGGLSADLVAFDVEWDELEDGTNIWRIRTTGGAERIVELPGIPPLQDVPSGEFRVYEELPKVNVADTHYKITNTMTGLDVVEYIEGYYDPTPISLPMGGGKVFAFVPCSFSRVSAGYSRISAREEERRYEHPPPEAAAGGWNMTFWYEVYYAETWTYESEFQPFGRESFDATKAFIITNTSIVEVEVTESVRAVMIPFFGDYSARAHDASIVSETISRNRNDLSWDSSPGKRLFWGYSRTMRYVESGYTGPPDTPPGDEWWQQLYFEIDGRSAIVYEQEPLGSDVGTSTQDGLRGGMEEKEIAPLLQYPTNWPLVYLGNGYIAGDFYTQFSSRRVVGPGIFTVLANPSIRVVPENGGIEGIRAKEDVIDVYLPDGPSPRRSFVRDPGFLSQPQPSPSDGDAPLPDAFGKWGTVNRPVLGELPEGTSLAPGTGLINLSMRYLAWDWDYPGYCRQQLAALGIYGNTTPDPEPPE